MAPRPSLVEGASTPLLFALPSGIKSVGASNTLNPSGPWLIHGVAFPHSLVGDILMSYGLPGVRGIQYPVYRGITPPPLGRLEAPGNRFSVIASLAIHRRACHD